MLKYVPLAISVTVLFAGSWCLSNNDSNLFHLCLSVESYLAHIAVWLGLFVLVSSILCCAAGKSRKLANKISLFLILICPINILDYGMRSIFGPVGGWSMGPLAGWALFTLLLPLIAIFTAVKIKVTDTFISNFIKISVAPCILLIFYGVQTNFVESTIVKVPVEGNGDAVHLMIFDMLSFDMLFQGGQVNEKFPNFRQFSADSEVYLKAMSPGKTTGQTIPRLIAGEDSIKVGHDNKSPWLIQPTGYTEMLDLADYENIFSLFCDAKYNVFLQAFAMPYTKAFSKYIQFGKVYPYDTLWRIGMHSLIWPVIYPGGMAHQHTSKEIIKHYKAGISNNPSNTFFYTHWNIPHQPFIFDSKGRHLKRLALIEQMIHVDLAEGFQNQLVGTDIFFGEIISAIKGSGKYDNSLVIVTADTNVKGLGYNVQHVPLFIKRPRQSKQRIIDTEVRTVNIKQYLKMFLLRQPLQNLDMGFERAS